MQCPSPWESGAQPAARHLARRPDPYSPSRTCGDGAAGDDDGRVNRQHPGRAHHPPSRDRVVAVAELPPALRPAFRFAYFNVVQSDCFDAAFGSDAPLVVAAPTGAGKTGVLDLALARRLLAPPCGAPPAKALYLAPSRALVQERLADWRARFGPLGVTAAELTGDADADGAGAARLVCATPEKLDAVTRGRGPRGAAAFVGDVGLVMLDEVHTLGDAGRGATLEVVVARLRTIGAAAHMDGTPLATARYVAVSATLPNAAHVGAWLGAGRGGTRVYGDEVRPVPLDVVVRAYTSSANDFIFERNVLDAHLPGVLDQFSAGRPALVFCASRKSAETTARALAAGGAGATRRAALDAASRDALAAAASRVGDRGLADALRTGVGFHHAGLDAGDRAVVEALFAGRSLPVLCTTSTLATGVNLPAYLVVVKGTRRWASEAGAPTGFTDYDRNDIAQMLGRGGRPQFDDRGVGVVMTRAGSAAAAAFGGAAPPLLESRLGDALGDALNAEIVLRTVADVEGAAAWFRATFLWARVAADPAAAGFPGDCPRDALERLAVQRHVAAALHELTAAGLVRADPGGTALTPLPPGVAAARHYVRLATVATLRRVPGHASVPDLLTAVCGAAELSDVPLRRGERKTLAALNRAAADAGLPAVGGGGARARVTTPAEKLFVLAVDACGPAPGAPAADFGLRRDADAVLRVGDRVCECAAAVFADSGALAATANSVRLGRALRCRAWDGTDAEVRQLRGVAAALGARLAAAGLGRLAALRGADARAIELATGRPYPFGADLLAAADALAPPPLTLAIAGAAWRSGGRLDASVTLTRAGDPPSSRGRSPYGVLIVGTPDDDELLLCERVPLDTFKSPYAARVTTRRGGGARVALVAALLPERVVGVDVVATRSFVAGEDLAQGEAAAAAQEAVPAAATQELAAPPSPRTSASPPPAARPAKRGLFDRFRLDKVVLADGGDGSDGAAASPPAAASVRRPTGGDARAAASPPRSPAKDDEYADVFGFL